MPERIHCRVRGCSWSTMAKNFEDGMAKLRRHRRKAHPSLFRQSVRKGIVTRKARRKARR